MDTKVENTSRGFGIIRFNDRYGEACSMQESSLASEPCIWLGCDKDFGHAPANGLARMHLTQGMAEGLIPLLQHFVETGELPQTFSMPTHSNESDGADDLDNCAPGPQTA